MDLDGNGRMDWFFSQWVYGTDIPRYTFDYTVTQEGDAWMLKASISQSEVRPNFKMAVPLYIDFDGQLVRAGSMRLVGNSTLENVNIKLPKKPRRVLVNANFDVLAQK